MRLAFVIVILFTFGALVVAVVAALSRHKKASALDIELIGRIAQADTKLDPEGTVIVCGEVWRAKSRDGAVIPAHARVCVVGFQDHLMLVTSMYDNL